MFIKTFRFRDIMNSESILLVVCPDGKTEGRLNSKSDAELTCFSCGRVKSVQDRLASIRSSSLKEPDGGLRCIWRVLDSCRKPIEVSIPDRR